MSAKLGRDRADWTQWTHKFLKLNFSDVKFRKETRFWHQGRNYCVHSVQRPPFGGVGPTSNAASHGFPPILLEKPPGRRIRNCLFELIFVFCSPIIVEVDAQEQNGALLIAACVVAAIRLRGEPIRPLAQAHVSDRGRRAVSSYGVARDRTVKIPSRSVIHVGIATLWNRHDQRHQKLR